MARTHDGYADDGDREDDGRRKVRLSAITRAIADPCRSLWNYNPGNNDTLGDDWNFENFSWFSEQDLDERTRLGAQGKELDEGCRLLKAFVVSFIREMGDLALTPP